MDNDYLCNMMDLIEEASVERASQELKFGPHTADAGIQAFFADDDAFSLEHAERIRTELTVSKSKVSRTVQVASSWQNQRFRDGLRLPDAHTISAVHKELRINDSILQVPTRDLAHFLECFATLIGNSGWNTDTINTYLTGLIFLDYR